jgi:hypothetical protein
VLTSDGTSGGTPTNSVGIDLNKHTITGDGTGSAITDLGTATDHTVIVNGKITGFNDGISLTSKSTIFYDSQVTIDNLNSSKN